MEHPSASFPSEIVLYVECGLLALIVLLSTVHRTAWSRKVYRMLSALAERIGSNARLVVLAGLAGLLGCTTITLLRGFPVPGTDDAAAYLVMGETFASGHLVNPPAPLFALVPEQVLEKPVYTGKYPPGQGLMLALGFLLGNPGLALLLSAGLLASAMTWCLLGWLPRRWALLGAILLLLRLAVGSYWNHSYWGGSVAAIGGALLFGGLGRLFFSRRRASRVRSLPAMAFGLSILAITRPWEGFLVSLPVLVWLVFWLQRRLLSSPAAGIRSLVLLSAIGGATLGFLAYYNYATTGSATRFAHQVYEQQRPVAGEFVWQRWLASENRMSWVDVDVPRSERSGWWWVSLGYFFHRLVTASYFLIGPTLLLCILPMAPRLWSVFRYRLLFVAWLLVALGHSIVHFHFPHYSAPLTAPLLILGLVSLRFLYLRPPAWFRQARVLLLAALLIEVVSFVIQLPALRDDPSEFFVRQAAITHRLEAEGGEHLILVDPSKAAVYNFRDLDAPVLWAADRGAESTAAVLERFSDRKLWLFDPYADPQLVPLDAENPTALSGPRLK